MPACSFNLAASRSPSNTSCELSEGQAPETFHHEFVDRNRLAGHDQKLQILADLYRPDAPQAKVLSYTPQPSNTDSAGSVPVPVARPADSAATDGAVPGGQAYIPASQPAASPSTSSSSGSTPAPKPNPDR